MTIVISGHFVRDALLLLSGLLIWAVHFTFVYVFNALACARHFADIRILGIGIVPAAIGAATFVALGAIGACLLMAGLRRSSGLETANEIQVNDFMKYMTVAVGALGAMAVLWSGITVLFIPPCG